MSEGYILNALQTPSLLRPVYDAVERGYVTNEEIVSNTGLDSNSVQEATDGLRYVRLLGREDGEYYTAELPWMLESNSLNFRMGILHNLAQECTPGDWGKQAVVLLNYQYLLEENIQYFKNNDKVLYDSINDWHRKELDYTPMSQQGEIDLNENKFVNWSRILQYLGLIQKVHQREHTVYPEREIIITSLSLAVEERGENSRIEIETYLDWLQKNLFPVTLTGDGDLPPVLSRVLYNLVRDDVVQIVERGDAGSVSLADTPRRDGIEPNANSIEVLFT